MGATELILGAIIGTALVWGGIEAYLGATGRPLITDKVRKWNKFTHGFVGLLFGLTTGLLGGHFFWCGG